MPRNGSGTFDRTDGVRTGADVYQQEESAGIDIEAVFHDGVEQDMADGITQSLSKDGQTLPTADLPMNTFRHTGVGDANMRSQYARASQIIDGTLTAFSAAGTDTYTGTLAVAISAYVNRMYFLVTVPNTNTVAGTTLNVDGVGAKAWVKGNDVAFAVGELRTNTPYVVEFNSALDKFTTAGMILVDDVTVEISTLGQLRVKDDGITPVKTNFMNNVNNIYGGEVRSDGVAQGNFPSGWTSSRLSQGNYRVTHTIGNTGFVPVCTVLNTVKYNIAISTITATVFEVQVNDIKNSPVAQDADWVFIVAQT